MDNTCGLVNLLKLQRKRNLLGGIEEVGGY